MHGIDLATIKQVASQPSRVYSMSDGIVTFVDPDGHTGSGYGPYVIVRNTANNDLWLYGDLSDNPSVVLNQTIIQGQLIGYEGNPSGTSSTGLHVHLEKENQPDGVFKYYYINSIDPTTGTGITNANYSSTGEIYFYDGTPVPPTPLETTKRKKFPWVLYANKLRNQRQI